MSRVLADLVVASFEESYDERALAGCTKILNVAEECDVPERVGRAYLKVGVRDDCPDTDITTVFPRCIQFADSAPGTTLVHCLEGVSRSVCAAVAIMCSRGMTPDEAFEAVRAVRAVDVFPRYEADTRRYFSKA